MIGESLSPILEDIEDLILEHQVMMGEKPNFTEGALIASVTIFASCLMDKIWELQEREGIDMEHRLAMVKQAGEDIRKIVRTYADVDVVKMLEE